MNCVDMWCDVPMDGSSDAGVYIWLGVMTGMLIWLVVDSFKR